jgi:hypothetical protein
VQRQVRRGCFGLDVDEQREVVGISPVDRAAVLSDHRLQRLEVEGPEGSSVLHRLWHIFWIVGDDELPFDQPYVGLYALEVVIERVEEGTLMLVVVVGVRPLEP